MVRSKRRPDRRLAALAEQMAAESGARAGYDGHRHKRGSKTPMAVDPLGRLPAMVVTLATE